MATKKRYKLSVTKSGTPTKRDKSGRFVKLTKTDYRTLKTTPKKPETRKRLGLAAAKKPKKPSTPRTLTSKKSGTKRIFQKDYVVVANTTHIVFETSYNPADIDELLDAIRSQYDGETTVVCGELVFLNNETGAPEIRRSRATLLNETTGDDMIAAFLTLYGQSGKKKGFTEVVSVRIRFIIKGNK